MKSKLTKGKFIILSIIILAVLITFRHNLQLYGIKLIGVFNDEKANELLLELETSSITIETARLMEIIEAGDFSVYNSVTIGDGSSMSGVKIKLDDAKKAYSIFKQFQLEDPDNINMVEYKKSVALTLWFAGLSDEAIDIIGSIDSNNSSKINESFDQVNLIKAGFDMTFANYESAASHLNKIQSPTYEDLKKSIGAVIALLSDPGVLKNQYYSNEIGKDVYHQLFSNLGSYTNVTKHTKKEKGHVIKGYVKDNDFGMSGVIVYLDNNPGMSSSVDFETFAVTDKAGYFEITGINDKAVSLGMEIPWQRIQDKQKLGSFDRNSYTFSDGENSSLETEINFYDAAILKKVEIKDGFLHYEIEDKNASENQYYVLKVRYANSTDVNSASSTMEIGFDNLHGSIELAELARDFDVRFSSCSYDDDLVIENFLEPLYLDSDYLFSVYPLRKEDGLYVSNGYFSNTLEKKLHVDGQVGYSKGDILMSDENFKDAVSWFEQNESLHGYKVLSTLYYRGYIDDPEKDYEYYREGRDLNKAIKYQRKLVDMLPNNKKQLSQLAYMYRLNKDYDKELEALTLLSEIDDSRYVKMNLARNMINRGNLTDGIHAYVDSANEKLDIDRYYQYIILANATELLPEEYTSKLGSGNRKTNMNPFFKLMLDGKYEAGYDWLNNQEDTEIVIFYRLMYIDAFIQNEFSEKLEVDGEYEDFIEYYTEKTNAMSSNSLRWILKEIKYDNNWFNH